MRTAGPLFGGSRVKRRGPQEQLVRLFVESVPPPLLRAATRSPPPGRPARATRSAPASRRGCRPAREHIPPQRAVALDVDGLERDAAACRPHAGSVRSRPSRPASRGRPAADPQRARRTAGRRGRTHRHRADVAQDRRDLVGQREAQKVESASAPALLERQHGDRAPGLLLRCGDGRRRHGGESSTAGPRRRPRPSKTAAATRAALGGNGIAPQRVPQRVGPRVERLGAQQMVDIANQRVDALIAA